MWGENPRKIEFLSRITLSHYVGGQFGWIFINFNTFNTALNCNEVWRQQKRKIFPSISNNQRAKLSQFRLHYVYVSFRTRRVYFILSECRSFYRWKAIVHLNLWVRCLKSHIEIYDHHFSFPSHPNNIYVSLLKEGGCIKMMKNILYVTSSFNKRIKILLR